MAEVLTGTPAQENCRGGGEISQKGTKDAILTSCPGMDLRDDHWGRIFEILEFTKGTNSGSLTISGRGSHEHVVQQYNNGITSVLG